MPEESDEAQAAPLAKPTAQTARQVADHALDVAKACRDAVGEVTDQLVRVQAKLSKAMPSTPALVTQLTEGLAAIREEMAGFQAGVLRQVENLRAYVKEAAAGEPSGAAVTMPEDALADRVTALVDTAMRPIIESANKNMAALVDRVEALEVVDGQRADIMAEIAEKLARKIDGQTESTSAAINSVSKDLGQFDARLNALEDRTDLPQLSVAGITSRLDALERGVGEHVAAEIERRSDSPGWMAMAEGDVEARLRGIVRDELNLDRLAPAPELAQDTPTPSQVGRVHAKVLELMQKVTAIGKDREANAGEGGRFMFRGIDAAMAAVGHAMRAVGLTMETSVLSREHDEKPVTKTNSRGETRTVIWSTTRLTARYTFVDPVDGSRHSFEGAGEGRDASDKATSKAMSMALKYGLFQALMIPVEGLDEADGEAPVVSQDGPPEQPAASSPAGSPAPAPSAPPANRPPPTKDEMARGALASLRAIDRKPPDQRPAELARILNKLTETGLATVVVEDATLAAHAIAISRTLVAPQQQQQQQQQSTGERNPWTDAPVPPPDDYPPAM